MNWLCCLLALLQAILALDYSRGAVVLDQQQTRLSFIQHAKCTYTYEVAVHTARGARSTASDGFRVHALVSLFLKTYFSSTLPPLPYKFFQLQIFMYDSRILHFVKELVLDGLAVLNYFFLSTKHTIFDYICGCPYLQWQWNIARALEDFVSSCTISRFTYYLKSLLLISFLSFLFFLYARVWF